MPRRSERNPLGGLVFDMACSWPMYRVPKASGFGYVCALYQQSHGASCHHNHIDGMVATRFLLGCIRQRLTAPKNRAKLEGLVREIANRENAGPVSDPGLGAKKSELASVKAKIERATQNMALADEPDQFRAISGVFKGLREQEKRLESELANALEANDRVINLETEVEAALTGLDRLRATVDNPKGLAGIGSIFREMNARLFFRFREVEKKKRIVNVVQGGIVAFGTSPPPIKLYEGPTGRRQLKGLITAGQGAKAPDIPSVSGEEGQSLGNVNRGDRICTFVNETVGLPLTLSILPSFYEFSGESVLQLVQRPKRRRPGS